MQNAHSAISLGASGPSSAAAEGPGLKTQRASKARGLNRQTLISVGDQPRFGEVELGFLLGLHLGVGQLYQHIGFYIHGRAWR